MAKIKRSKSDSKYAARTTGQFLGPASYAMATKVAAKRDKENLPPGQFHAVHAISANEKIAIIKNGVSKNDLKKIKEQSSLDYNTLSNILSVSRAKLLSKKGADKFDHVTSERIMLLADIIAYGQSVFEDKDAFNEWIKKNNVALGGKSPLNLMDTVYGIQEVKKEIGRIEHGIF